MHSDDGEEVHSVSLLIFSSSYYLVGIILIFLFLLSGCLVGETVYYGVDVELLNENEIVEISQPVENITDMDFSDYPTLYQAITFLIDPSTNESSVLLETPNEEWNRIQSLIEENYFTYYQYYFSIAYVTS